MKDIYKSEVNSKNTLGLTNHQTDSSAGFGIDFLFKGMACVGLSFMLYGCGTTPPSNFYTLSSLPNSEQKVKETNCHDVTIAVGRITFPDYLQQENIVTRTSPNKLVVDEFNRWGGAISEDFGRVFALNLSRQLNIDSVFPYPVSENFDVMYRVGVDVQQFDGELGEIAYLDVVWSIYDTADEKTIEIRHSRFKQDIAGANYEQYVVAQSKLVVALSDEVASEFKNYCSQ